MKYSKLLFICLLFNLTVYAQDYYPLKVDNVWNYIFGEPPNMIVKKVFRYNEENGRYLVVDQFRLKNMESYGNLLLLEKNKSGVWLLSIGGGLTKTEKEFNPPKPILKYPLKINKKWVYTTSAYYPDDSKETYTVKNYCDKKVIAGHFSNVCEIECLSETLDTENMEYKFFSKSIQYYAPEIGLILEVGIDENDNPFRLFELTNYDITK